MVALQELLLSSRQQWESLLPALEQTRCHGRQMPAIKRRSARAGGGRCSHAAGAARDTLAVPCHAPVRGAVGTLHHPLPWPLPPWGRAAGKGSCPNLGLCQRSAELPPLGRAAMAAGVSPWLELGSPPPEACQCCLTAGCRCPSVAWGTVLGEPSRPKAAGCASAEPVVGGGSAPRAQPGVPGDRTPRAAPPRPGPRRGK